MAEENQKQQGIKKLSTRHSETCQKEIAKRLWAIAETTGESVSSERVKLYLENLMDIPYEKLISTLESMIRTFKWFPKIPEIRDAAGYSQKAIDSALEMEAERQWLVVLEDVESSGWDCDNYLYGRDELKYPYENEATQYAVRQAGGIYGMLKRGESERHWAKKEFIDAFCRYTKTGALQATISDKEILQRLMANVNQKRLQ